MKDGFESELEEKFPASRLLETVDWNGKKCFTLMTGMRCVFFAADKKRAISRALELPAPMGISATTGDFNADGLVDVAIASHAEDANDGTFQNSWIWLNSKDGFKVENRIAVKTKSASSVNAMENMVVFGQCAADGLYTNDARTRATSIFSGMRGAMCACSCRTISRVDATGTTRPMSIGAGAAATRRTT